MKSKLDYSGFFALSIFASFLNYLTYPVLARVLPTSQFVNVTVALTLLTQISTFLSSIVALTIGFTKLSDKDESAESILSLQKVVMSMFVVLILLFTALSPLIFKRIDVPLFFIIPICLLLLFSIPTSIISGYLNGVSKLMKLGLVAILTATFQFIFSVSIGVLTKNGGLALLAMSFGQLFSITAIIYVLRNDNLPNIVFIPKLKYLNISDPKLKSLLRFTVFSSFGIMIVNLLQIIDLLLIKRNNVDVIIYTDLYIISRVVFFAGSIFIWPFLASININEISKNIKPLIKLVLIYTLISFTAILMLSVFGQEILEVFIGRTYKQDLVSILSTLGIIYKFSFLIITSLILYFIVIRNKAAYYVPGLISIILALFLANLEPNTSTVYILSRLNIIGCIGVIVCFSVFFYPSLQKYLKRRH